jgi:hypothetical protein
MKADVAFVRKPAGIEELISWDKEAKRRTPYVIEKTIDLDKAEFDRFSSDLFADQEFIKENIDRMYVDKNGVWHCILIKAIGESNAILANAEGYDYPRYAAFVEA